MPFCPACGRQVDEKADYCPACGMRLAGPLVPPTVPARRAVAQGPNDRQAIRNTKLFAIILLAGDVLSYVISFVVIFSLFSAISVPTTPSTTVPPEFLTALGNLFSALLWITSIGLILAWVASLEFRLALRSLARIDEMTFGTPSKLMLLYLVGLPLLAFGLVFFLYALIPFFSGLQQVTTPPSTVTSVPFPFNNLALSLTFLGLGLVGAVLSLIGEIGGLLLGLWRMGTRYDTSLFKAAAILFLIPYGSFLSPILALIGAVEAEKKLSGAAKQ